MVARIGQTTTQEQAQLFLKSEMWRNYLSQRLPASQRILNLGVSLNYVSGWIIGPFHQTVKIWSSHLDIRPADHPFLSVFGSSATIRAVSQYQGYVNQRLSWIAVYANDSAIVAQNSPVCVASFNGRMKEAG